MKNNKQRFTLLELIVVIIILGVLTSLALPRLFSNIEFSRSAEALNTMGLIRASIERCSIMNAGYFEGPYYRCGDWGYLDLDYPGDEPGSHFDYSIGIQDPFGASYIISGVRNDLDGGDNGVSRIFLVVDSISTTPGTIIRGGTGVFASIQ